MRNIVLFVFALIFSLSLPAVADADSDLPAEFIAVSESRMTWADAKAWCEQQGGRLPLVGGSESFDDTPSPGTPLEGFGATGGPWPVGLPSDSWYWTGTERSIFPGNSWFVFAHDGYVSYGASQSGTFRVACVP